MHNININKAPPPSLEKTQLPLDGAVGYGRRGEGGGEKRRGGQHPATGRFILEVSRRQKPPWAIRKEGHAGVCVLIRMTLEAIFCSCQHAGVFAVQALQCILARLPRPKLTGEEGSSPESRIHDQAGSRGLQASKSPARCGKPRRNASEPSAQLA